MAEAVFRADRASVEAMRRENVDRRLERVRGHGK
jgi:hypothetical protein